jgi:hypothetical protein
METTTYSRHFQGLMAQREGRSKRARIRLIIFTLQPAKTNQTDLFTKPHRRLGSSNNRRLERMVHPISRIVGELWSEEGRDLPHTNTP